MVNQYYIENKERCKEAMRTYYQMHKEKIKNDAKEYFEKNKEQQKENQKNVPATDREHRDYSKPLDVTLTCHACNCKFERTIIA